MNRRMFSGSALFMAVMWLGYAAYAIDRSVLSAVLKPMAASLGLTNLQLGLLGSAQYIGVLAFVLLAGHLSDLFGRRIVLLAGLLVFTAFTWLIGFASGFPEAFVLRLVSGAGEGIFWPVAMAAVADHFAGSKGLALGLFYVGFDVGSVAGNLTGGLAFSFFGDWHQAFFIAPLFGIPVIVGALLVREGFADSAAGRSGIRLGRGAPELLRRRGVPAMLLFAFLATAGTVWQNVFLAYYFGTAMKMPVLIAAVLTSVIFVSGAAGKLLIGGFSDRWRRHRLLVGLSCSVVAADALFFLTTDIFAAVAAELALGFLSAAVFPVMQALMSDLGAGLTGTALGLNTTSQSLATVVGPLLSASLFSFGVGQALALVAMAPAAAMAVVALFIGEPRPAPDRMAAPPNP